MYWVGSKEDIETLESQITEEITKQPEYTDGKLIPKELWVTKRWAEPVQLSNGLWAIPVNDNYESSLNTIDSIDSNQE